VLPNLFLDYPTAYKDIDLGRRSSERRRTVGLTVLNGMSQISRPSDELFQKIVGTFEGLKTSLQKELQVEG
jgi:hypothetical protein